MDRVRDGDKIYVLNAGMVQLIDVMGDDDRIVQVARAFRPGKAEGQRLLRYMMKHGHTSPFEHAHLTFLMVAPLFVARQLVRHRTANWNEISGRYVEFDEEFYVPMVEHIQQQSKKNLQGRGDDLPLEKAMEVRELIRQSNERSFFEYKKLLNAGVARELARVVLPTSLYTEWAWTMDLHNCLHMLDLRTHETTQLETRLFAEAVEEFVSEKFPVSYVAWRDYRKGIGHGDK